MTATTAASQPTMTDQVTRMYEAVAGYHVTHLLEIARELGVWDAITHKPGLTSHQLADIAGVDDFYVDVLCRTAFAFGFLDRDGAGWRMGPHFDQILGKPESSFYLAGTARVHMLVGDDYRDYPRLFRTGGTKPYQSHGDAFMREVATALKSLPAIFVDYVLPQLPRFHESLRRASWLLDAGCGAGWALVQFAQRFPKLRCTGVDVEPYSVSLAKDLILRHGLSDRCEARLGDAGQILASAAYDVATSFLVIHELDPGIKPAVFRSVAQCLAPGGSFLVFDEAYPENDDDLRTMPGRFAALAQWYELTWGNRVNTRSELHSLCRQAGLEVTEETAFSRFHILVATKQ